MIGISEELKNTDPDLLSPLTLAFIGDTVFDLLVRGNLVMQANRPVGKLHPLAAKRVCAAAQARAAQVIAPVLTEHEADIYRRGRNAHTGSAKECKLRRISQRNWSRSAVRLALSQRAG